jgi:hypothetical protein
MSFFKAFLAAVAFLAILAKSDDCFDHNLDITGPSVNGENVDHFDTAVQCQDFCNCIADANFFSWADGTFFDPDFHLACHCKAEKASVAVSAGIVSGPVSCDEGGS